ncbi:MAG: TlyA family rRNA (cytidine-2'-O)-methyltransferase [Ponticaulis sp.]|nr:TlyA family rRNA (cytidine-2'-O)-methyltransferase [Ponticaulis sp.]
MDRKRLDKFLIDTGQMTSRSEAQAAIEAGKVFVNGRQALKASEKVSPDDEVTSEKAHPYVSRAALKLKGALDAFDCDVSGAVCLDVGCSTGGFTEVLLEYGADHVFAVDVGRDQFHERLRANHQITLYEQTDARNLTEDLIDRPVDLVVCDASFIALEKVLNPALGFARAEATGVFLFKPQFQVGRKNVGKGGIVTDTQAVELARDSFAVWLEAQGWQIASWALSVLKGADGNQEWVVLAKKGAP